MKEKAKAKAKHKVIPNAIKIISTDFGEARIGRKLNKWMADAGIDPGNPPRRGKKGYQYIRMLRAIGFLAELEFMNGGYLRKTP